MSSPDDQAPSPAVESDPALQAAVREIETHVADAGWDQPARLYALVSTADLVQREPALATAMGLEAAPEDGPGALTPVEQDHVPVDRAIEDVLDQIVWPVEVTGAAAVVERLVLPPGADEQLPDDPAAAERYAADHPDRQEVRIVAAALRDGSTYCALRLRAHDEASSVVEAPDLVPGLLELVRSTLAN